MGFAQATKRTGSSRGRLEPEVLGDLDALCRGGPVLARKLGNSDPFPSVLVCYMSRGIQGSAPRQLPG